VASPALPWGSGGVDTSNAAKQAWSPKVAVVDTASGTVTGAIPVGWYPTTVAVGSGGNLLVVNAKGTASANPNPGHVKPTNTSPNPFEDNFYDLSIIEGNVSNIPMLPRWLPIRRRSSPTTLPLPARIHSHRSAWAALVRSSM